MRRLLLPVLAVALLGVPAVAHGDEAFCPVEVLAVRGTNPSYATMGALLDQGAALHDVPKQVLKAIAYRESTWRQFHSDGRPLISGEGDGVCGVGLMQVTLDEATMDGERLAGDVVYNIEQGAKILAQKWADLQNQTHPHPVGYGPDDPAVLENWYAAICRYNGCLGTTADLAYALPVSKLIAYPFQQGVPAAILAHMPPGGFTTPYDVDADYDFPHGFQAQHDPAEQFVFYDPDTGVVDGVVPARTHLASTPFTGYGAGGYGPNGPSVSCVDCAFWRPVEGTGIAGWAHWTSSVTGSDQARVTWTPPRTGEYAVSAFVPALGAETLATATYHLGSATQTVDQNAVKGGWVSLGRRQLSAASPVWLGDHSTAANVKIVADALRLSAVTSLSLTRSASAVTYGSPVTLTMRLAQAGGGGLTGRKVTLQKRAVGSTSYTTVGTYTTGTDGRVTLTAKPAVNTYYRLSYTAPDAATLSATAVTTRVDVRPKVTAALSGRTVSARVTPAHAGQHVYLQRLVSGVWRNVTSKPLSSTGAASFTITPPGRGTWYYRVHKPADADHVAGASATLTLRVT